MFHDPDKLIDILQNAQKGDQVASGKFLIALQAFMNQPVKQYQKKIQAFGVSTDFEKLTKDAFNVIIEEDNFDLKWEQCYRLVTLGKGQDSWEIANVENGITFNKVEEGERIEVNSMSGTKITAYVDYYGGALGWTDKMIRFRKIPMMVDMAMQFRNKFYTNKADNHYALLATAAALNTTAYQGVAADGQLQRDIQTINQAAFTLTNRNKDKGYGDMASATLVMYANPLDKRRINAAFRATTQAAAANGTVAQQVEYNINVQYTFNRNVVGGAPILILPKNKIQRAEPMAPKTYNAPTDVLTLNETQAVWAIYGAIVGDSDQAQTITLG